MRTFNYQNRIEKVRKEMAKNDLKIAVFQKQGTIAYLGGAFAPTRSAVIVPLDGDVVLITDKYDVDRIRREETWIPNLKSWEEPEGVTVVDSIIETIRENGLQSGRIGMELGASRAPGLPLAADYIKYTAELPDAKFVDVEPFMGQIMMVKEEEEILALRRAAEIADAGVEAAIAAIAPGKTEFEIAGVMEQAMRKLGNEWAWSATGGSEVSSGYRTAPEFGWITPPSGKIIQRGDLVRVDVSTMYNLYLGDLYCTFSLGEPSPEVKRIAGVWEKMTQAMLAKIKAGVICHDIAEAALKVAEENGCRNCVVPVFGHGLGTDARIPPRIALNKPTVLPNNTVFILVAVLTQPGVGGLMLETPVLVREDGYELLSKLPLKLMVI